MSVTALVMATCPHLIAAIYTSDDVVHAMAVRLLVMAAIFQIFDGLQVAGAGALRGLKDTAIPMVITLVAYWGLGLPLGVMLGLVRNGGPQSLWIGLIAGLVAAALLLNARFVLLTRKLMANARCDDSYVENDKRAAAVVVESPVAKDEIQSSNV
jgi:MATE family multidrug resistance protein